MELLNRFWQTLQTYGSPARVIVAVSGGMDSVVLADLCHRCGLNFSMVHCNFQLRGTESDRDESFVRSLAKKFEVPLFVKKFDTYAHANDHKLSIQEAARVLRYSYFEEVRKKTGAQFTLLAHHADDNIETLLMNFFRGTGLEGLTGMPKKNPAQAQALRPLLHARRAEILSYAKAQQLNWIEDSSNTSVKYTRNYFRNELLPALKKVYPQVEENLLANLQRFEKTNLLYRELLADFKKKVCVLKGEEVHIPVLKLLQYAHTSLVYEIIHDFGFGEAQVAEVLKLTEAESGKYITNETYQIIRHRKWLVIAPVTPQAETRMVERQSKRIVFAGGQLTVNQYSKERWKLNPSAAVAQLDSDKVEWPLLLRRWKQGDYFYPLGMRKKKKLARFFIDQKLSKSEKEKIWVLESHKRIVWIVGHRIDDRFKVTEATKNILEFTLTSP